VRCMRQSCILSVACSRRDAAAGLLWVDMRMRRDLNSMTMSDWIVFLDTVSPLVLSGDSFPKEVMQMWVPLRRALLYYVRYWDGQHTEANWQQARNDLLKYARLAEDNFGMQKLMTMQLHTAVVHLTDMVIAYGPCIRMYLVRVASR